MLLFDNPKPLIRGATVLSGRQQRTTNDESRVLVTPGFLFRPALTGRKVLQR
jgi:hypothetical protein